MAFFENRPVIWCVFEKISTTNQSHDGDGENRPVCWRVFQQIIEANESHGANFGNSPMEGIVVDNKKGEEVPRTASLSAGGQRRQNWFVRRKPKLAGRLKKQALNRDADHICI